MVVQVNSVLLSIIVFSFLLTTAYYLYETYYVRAGHTLIQLRNDYENAYVQIIDGEGKPCAPGEVGFAVYVKWDNTTKKFVKMCVYPTPGEEAGVNTIRNDVVIVPAG